VKNLATTRFEPVLNVGPLVYNLYAVVVHEGASASSGHYFAIVKREASVQWVLFNDTKVSVVSFEESVQSIEKSANKCAYMLFYKAETPAAPARFVRPAWTEDIIKHEREFVHGELQSRTSQFMWDLQRQVVFLS
jgi:hypothetical protein